LEADLLRPHGARTAVGQTLAALGSLDGVAHLMGGFEGGRHVPDISDETWDRMLDLNLRSAFYVFRAALPHLIQARHGRLAAIGSRPAADPPAGLAAYSVSKAGLVALVRTIAAEGKDSGVTANIVLPSVIDTPSNRAANPGADYSKWVQPASIARLLVWLMSDSARDVSGAVIPVYGRA
jgi:NAD(P)-dependent dehydrogenase (short-subunit alcohol dehydrogenase family)